MARELRQSTSVDLPIGPFVDQTDGFTAETALTITQPDIRLKKNAVNWAQKAAAQTLTHEENGYYEVTLDATDTDTLGQLRLAVNEAGALPVFEDFCVVTQAYWDAKYAGTGNGIRADVQVIASGAITAAVIATDAIDADAIAANAIDAAAIATGAITAAKFAANAIDAAALASDAVTEIQSGLATAAALDAVDNFVDTEITDIQNRLPAALVGGRISADVGSISGDATAADNLEAEYDNTGFKSYLRRNTAQAGAASSITLDTGANASDDYYNNCVVAIMAGAGAGQARFVGDYVGSTRVVTVSPNWVTNPDNTSIFEILPFAAIPGATAPTAAEVADAVWDEDATAHQTQGTFGRTIGDQGADTDSIWALANTSLDATVSSRATQASVDAVDNFVDTEIADIQARLPAALVGGRIDANVGAISGDATAADNLETAFDDTAGPVPHMGIIDQGTAQAATGTTLQLRAAATFANDTPVGATLQVLGSTQGYWQTRQVIDYDSATDTATVDAWTVTPSGTITYKLYGTPPGSTANPAPTNVVQISGDATAADNLESAFDGTGGVTLSVVLGANAVTAASIATDAIDADAIAANAIDSGAIANGAITAAKFAAGAIDATAIANGAIDAATFVAGAIDSTAIAADAIGSSELAASAVTEIANAVRTEVQAALSVDTYAEPGQGNPAATASLATKLGFVYKAWRNRHTQSATEYALFADDGTTKDQEADVSDTASVFERGEVRTGA